MPSSSHNTDFGELETLAAAAQGGDKSAYSRLLENSIPYIRSLVRYRIGQVVDVDDVVQECLLAIHVSLHTYDPSRRIKPWVNAIIRYKTVDYLKARSRNEERAFDGELDATPAADPPNEAMDGSGLTDGGVWTLVEQLPDPMREAIVLTKREGLSTTEAARRIGVSGETLRKRVSRAYRKLAQLYEKTYRTEDEHE